MTTNPTEIATLPEGHDDPASPFWIPEDLREHYPRTKIPADFLDAALAQRGEYLDRLDWGRAWDAWRAKQERRLEPGEYRRWIATNTSDGVTPTINSMSRLRDLDSDFFKHLLRKPNERRPLTDAETALVVHEARMRHVSIPRSAEDLAESAAKARARNGCDLCGSTTDLVPQATRYSVKRRCRACDLLVPILQAALSPVSGSPTRLAALLANLPDPKSGKVQRPTDEQVEAWLNSDAPLDELLSHSAERLVDSPTAGRLRRLFGGKGS